MRMKTVLQVLAGLVLCIGIGEVLIYSSLPIFWEHEDLQPHVYSLTWRSDVMLVLLHWFASPEQSQASEGRSR
jgi:hypothetical protein